MQFAGDYRSTYFLGSASLEALSRSSSSCFFFTMVGTNYRNHLHRLSEVGIWLQSRRLTSTHKTLFDGTKLALLRIRIVVNASDTTPRPV